MLSWAAKISATPDAPGLAVRGTLISAVVLIVKVALMIALFTHSSSSVDQYSY